MIDISDPVLNSFPTWIQFDDVSNFFPTANTILDEVSVPLENHPGNPKDSRYWKNFIPSYYNVWDREGINVNENGPFKPGYYRY